MSLIPLAIPLFGFFDAAVAQNPCDDWKGKICSAIVSLHPSYPELAAFDVNSAFTCLGPEAVCELEYRKDVISRRAMSSYEEHVVFQGKDATFVNLFLAPTKELENCNLRSPVGYFDGEICGYSYFLRVEMFNDLRGMALHGEILDAIEGLGLPSGPTRPSPLCSVKYPRKEIDFRSSVTEQPKLVLPCSVSTSSSKGDWWKAVDGKNNTGWCPKRSDRRKEFKIELCSFYNISNIAILSERGPLMFQANEKNTSEVQIDKVVIPLSLANAPQKMASQSIAPAKLRNSMTLTIRMSLASKGRREKCINEISLELDGKDFRWPKRHELPLKTP